ncbi:MAG: HEAT repeat domain-containing protein [Phycisphaerales bacterium]|nr:HEAT repeat domain-containing protein [Phycisphaerales bacterium]
MAAFLISLTSGLLAWGSGCAPAVQATAPEARQSAPSTARRGAVQDAPDRAPAGDDLTPEQQDELADYIEIIASDAKEADFRRFAAEGLLKSDLPTRIDAVIGLLAGNGSTGKAMALCGAIASLGPNRDDRLDERLVTPLLAILGHEDAALSAAAAGALAAFRSPEVARVLGDIARDELRPIAVRTAAIDALSPSTNRREVVGELISLLKASNPTIVNHAVGALTPASRTNFGTDIEKWQSWWKEKEAMTEAQWIENRLELAIEQQRALRKRLQDAEAEYEKREREVTKRFGDALRIIDQLTTQPAQKDARRQGWLEDPLADIRLAALALIRDQIVTAGDPLSQPLRDSVKKLFADSAPPVRIAAHEIIGHLKDPADAEKVLGALRTENDSAVRATMLRVLGGLENPAAIPALISELAAPTTSVDCVCEAARSLGLLGVRGKAPTEIIAGAVRPLLNRFSETPADNIRLRESLLGAMAMIADPAFVDAFVVNLTAESPEILLAAIRGIKAVGVRERINDVLTHLAHPDARVRQVAAEAVGSLGEEQHLEALLNRMAPSVESTAGVRDAAFVGFRDIVLRIPAPARLKWADRLGHLPDRRIQLLTALVDSWVAANANPPEMTAARERLVEDYMAQNKYAEAIPHLERVHAILRTSDPARADAVGLTLVTAALRSNRTDGGIDLISNVAAAADAAGKKAITDSIMKHLEAMATGADNDSTAAVQLIHRLRTIPDDSLGSDWHAQLGAFERRLGEPRDAPDGNDRPTP